jgi:hypothetical protein
MAESEGTLEQGTPRVQSRYAVHPGVQAVQDWISGLRFETGRSLEEWLELIRTSGPATERERRDWLRDVHALGLNSAWWIAARAEGKGAEDGDPDAYLRSAERYVEEMFLGKEALRPVFERILDLAAELGPDVRVCPCQTIVPIYRAHVVAQVKPSTKRRLDLGIALGILERGETPARLLPAPGVQRGDRITHRFELSSPEEVDPVVVRWLQRAYDLDE